MQAQYTSDEAARRPSTASGDVDAPAPAIESARARNEAAQADARAAGQRNRRRVFDPRRSDSRSNTNSMARGCRFIMPMASRESSRAALNEITQSLPEVVEQMTPLGDAQRNLRRRGDRDRCGRERRSRFRKLMRRFGRRREIERLRVEQPVRFIPVRSDRRSTANF